MVSQEVKVPYHLLDIQSWSKKHKKACFTLEFNDDYLAGHVSIIQIYLKICKITHPNITSIKVGLISKFL